MGITQQIGASSLIRPGVIDNAAARPASPYEGQAVYQKDTDQVLYWNGSAWYPNWNLPWGIVGEVSRSTTHTATTSLADISSMSITFNAVANRYYEYTFHCSNALNGTVGATRMRIDYVLGSTAINKDYASALPSGYIVKSSGLFITTTGSKTFKMQTQIDIGSTAELYADTTSLMRLYIKDIGPA